MIFNLLLDGASTGTGTTNQPTPWTSYLIMGLLVVAIIGLFVWQSFANKKKRKQAQEMVSSLKIGDRVKTIGGICGFVVEVNDAENTFVLETGTDVDKSFVKFDKGAIYQTAPANGNVTSTSEANKKEEKDKYQ